MATKQKIFLSSCFADPEGTKLNIRNRIAEETGEVNPEPQFESDRPIWMAEDFKQIKEEESSLNEFEKVGFCLDGVRNAECFVAIITERHGSQIELDGIGDVTTSFFEAELFEAALLGKPSYIFLHKDYEPEKKMANLLKLLKPAFPHMYLEDQSEDAIMRKIDKLLEHFEKPRWQRRFLPLPNLGLVVDTQYARQHCPYDPKISGPQLRFLNYQFKPNNSKPDVNHIKAILERTRTEESHQVRLTLIWFAIRALMRAPFQDPSYRNYRPLWERAFRMWVSNCAWYGLHGHFRMSCLAALGSLDEICISSADKADPTLGRPHGPLASEYYSIARFADRRAGDIFNLALNHINLGIDSNRGDLAGQIATRASILLQKGHSEAALKDYQRAAELRRDQGGGVFGEALSEWGYARFRTGEKSRGINLMEEGFELLKSAPPSGNQARAMLKLAIGYARSGKIRKAIKLIREAQSLAQRIGAYDQIYSLRRLAKLLRSRVQKYYN